jgi:hypothetical protein
VEAADDPGRQEEIKAELAYKKLCQKILPYYENGCVVNYEGMDETEKALCLPWSVSTFMRILTIFSGDLDRWRIY